MELYLLSKTWLTALLALSGLVLSIQTSRAEPEPEATVAIITTWQNKYVSQGRDNLGNGGIFSFDATAELHGLTAGAFLATGDKEPYEEINLYTGYSFELGPLDAYVGYTHLEFLRDDENDNEISVAIAFNSIPHVVPALDYTYSDKSAGGFLEFSLRAEIRLLKGQLTLAPCILEGFDFGYTSEEHDGPNNFQIGTDFAWTVNDQVDIVGSLAHSWALADVRNDGLGDVSWITIGISVGY